MMRYVKALGGLLLACALAACGGGGGSAGATSGSGGTGGTGGTGGSTTPTIASFIFQLSKSALTNTGADSSALTVTALDASNNPVAGAPVSVAVDTGVYTPGTSTTDAKGQAGGTITIGSNKANRNITATINVGGQTATAVIAVTGSQITLSPVPATPAPGTSVRLDIKAADANGTGIPGVTVQLSGTLGLTGTVTTDATGNATATLGAAPAATGTYTIDASALGVTATRSVQVVSSTGGGIPNGVGPISSASLAIVPNTIAPNAAGSTTNRAALRAKFLTASNQAIQNVRVRFEIVPPGLGSGEQISTGTATVFSDVNGEAIADYIAGTRSSPTNGVVIRACYGLTDADIAGGACANSVTQTLTVASQPLSITLGDNNTLARGNNSLTYIKQFDVAVVDAAGNAVSGAVISASVDINTYDKGLFAGPRVTCANEDTNRNGFLDTGEDVNNNGTLEPHKADISLSNVGSNTTGTNGRMNFQVEYPQNVATWLVYTVRVTTSVAGSEGTVSRSFVTGFIEGDDKNGSFLTAPYGVNGCTSAN
jgi:hypothetical protein